MGEKEFASQQPTQNLGGRGGRGVYNTAGVGMSAGDIRPPSLCPHWNTVQAEVWDPNWARNPLPPLPFSFKLTKKRGLPQSQHSAGKFH